MTRSETPDRIQTPSDEDLERLQSVLRRIGGPTVTWGAQAELDLWLVEQRAKLDRQISERIRSASWALVVATIGLVVCTAGLIWATLVV